MSEQGEFWSRIAVRYDSVIDLQVGADTRRRLRERITENVKTFGAAAEFGCGTGFFTDAIASRADSALAVDLAPGMLALARTRCKEKNIIFRQEDCQKTSISDRSLDTTFLSLVLHFTDPVATLKEMRRMLRPGGMLVVLNLDLFALRPLSRLCARMRILYYGITHYRTKPPKNFGRSLLSARDLSGLLVKTGFENVAVEGFKSPGGFSDVPIEFITATSEGPVS